MSARDATPFDAAPTTRCHPRSMHHAGGCFRQDPEYCCAIERPHVGPRGEWWLYAACAVIGLAGAAAGLSAVGWLAALVAAGGVAWRLARREE